MPANPFLLVIVVIDSAKHFLLSACLGGSVFYTTWIMFWFCGLVDSPLPWTIFATERADRFTYLSCWLSGLLASSVAHCFLDGLLSPTK